MADRRPQVTGCILAGGQGRRFGGADKGLLMLDRRPLVEHTAARLRPQVDELVINANRNIERYRDLGITVLSDPVADYAGPLAGCLAALRHATTTHVMIVPCDSPFIPLDLVARLWQVQATPTPAIRVVRCNDRLQPVFALIETALAPSLAAYLAAGERKIDHWFAQHRLLEVDFEADAAAFMNINSPADLTRAEARLASHAADA
ncbi:MAG: molybdenum cofactor guanylyltransferase MobA [Gammaproteobacteria bacterium]